MSQKEAAMFDHANVNKTGAWEEFEKQLRSAMETKSVESQVRVKPTAGHSHFPQGPGQKSSWIFELKRTHIHMLHYPEVLDGSAGWHEETNMHRSLYYAAMQQHLHTMLAKNFEEYEKSIFEKYNPQNDVSEADAALLGRAVTRHIVEADQPAGAHYGDIDERWPYGTYAYLELKKRYQGQRSVHVFTLMSEYNLLRKQVSTMTMTEWAQKIKSKKHEIDKAKVGQDPEYIDCMQLLLDMSEVPAWKEWAQTDATKEGVSPGYYTVDALFQRAILMHDMRDASAQSNKLTVAGGKLALAAASGNAASGFLGGPNQPGMGPTQDRKKPPSKMVEWVSKKCMKCNKTFITEFSLHKKCPDCFGATRARPTQEDIAQHAPADKAKELREKDNRKNQRDQARKRDRGRGQRRAGGRKADAVPSSGSSSDSEEDGARGSKASAHLAATADTTRLITAALAKASKSEKRGVGGSGAGCKPNKHLHFEDSDDEEEDRHMGRDSKRQRSTDKTFSVGASGARAGGFMAKGECARASKGETKKSSAHAFAASIDAIYFIVDPPEELPQSIPEYFLLVDSGATHHMVSQGFWLAYMEESHMKVSWGKEGSYSRALGIGWMVFLTYDSKDKKPRQMLVTTGQADTLLIPDVSRPLAASNRWSAQGHTPHLEESKPGLIGFNDEFFIPFCFETTSGYFLCPCYPPPNQAIFQTAGNSGMSVVNLNQAIDNGKYSSIYMNKMVCMGAAGDADLDDMNIDDIMSAQSTQEEANNGQDHQDQGGEKLKLKRKADAAAEVADEPVADGEDISELDSETEYTSESDVMADDESETELNKGNSNNLGKRVRRDIDSSSGRSEKRKSAKGKDKEKQRVNTDADGDEGKPHSKKPSAGINKRKRRGRDPVEKGIARERRAINLFKTTSEKLTLRQALVKAHQRYGHVAPSRLVGFKSKGKIYSSLIPSSGRLEFKSKHCPICLAMKGKKPPKPQSLPKEERKKLGLWEKVGVDSSGKFRVASFQGNKYYTVFVCAKSGRKLYFPHKKKSQMPIVFLKFVAHVGCFPKVVVADKAGEILSKTMSKIFTAKFVKLRTVGVDEHFANGGPEKAIQDIDYMVACIMADKNLPKNCWDIVGEHATLINACLNPCPVDKSITIYECETGEIPNLDAIPEVGSFAVRYLAKIKKSDFKLSPKNQAGVFVGFATLKGTYGSVLMVGEGKYVVAREHVNYVQDHFPLQKEKSANPELDWLHRLLGRQNDNELAAAEQVEGGTSRGPQDSTEWEEEVAFDPSLLAPGEADCAEDDSDGLASDDEVKAVLEQLDESIPHLSQYTPAVSDTVVSQASQDDGQGVESINTGKKVGRGEGTSSRRVISFARDEIGEDLPPRRSKRQAVEVAVAGRDAINSAEFRARPELPSGVDKAKTIDTISEKDLRANKTLLVGRKIKRFFPQLGGAWGLVESYHVDSDSYKLRYGVDGYTEKLLFEDVLKLLPKSWFRRMHEANIAAAHMALAGAAHAVCFGSEGKPERPAPEDWCHFTQPTTHRGIANAPDKEYWHKAQWKEILTMEKMGCWEVMSIKELPDGAETIGCKWVLKLKFRDGEYDKHRARIVALGYQQQKGRDFFDTFSPTCNHVSIRLILALTSMPGWGALDLDAEAAFVSSNLGEDEEVYMKIPPGFEDHYGKNNVLRLRRSLYGLCQSPLNYYKLVTEVYLAAGLTQCKADECVFVRFENNIKGGPKTMSNEDLLKQGYFLRMETVPERKRIYPSCQYSVAALIIAVYVDNNACRYNCIELVEEFESFLKQDGRIKMLREGKLEWLLGVRYHFDEETGAVSCNQESNIDNILKEWGYTSCNIAELPMSPSVDLESLPIPEEPNKAVITAYASLIGQLLYVAINTVPQISYVMSALTRYMTRATEAHLGYAKHVLRYLKGVKHRKITWCAANCRDPHNMHEIWACADASYADVKPSRKSTMAYALFVNNAVFSWKSSLSSIVATSTCEAELMAYCSCACEVLYARKLAAELGFCQLTPTKIYEDNEGAIVLVKNMHLRNRSKHIALRFSFAKILYEMGHIKPLPVASEHQHADIGTKPVGPQILKRHVPVWLGEKTQK